MAKKSTTKPQKHECTKPVALPNTAAVSRVPNPGEINFPQDATPAERINMLHRAAKELSGAAVKYAIATGIELLRVKKSLPHGEFGDWIKTACMFSPRTASNYMTLANKILITWDEDGTCTSSQTERNLLAEGADYSEAIDHALDSTLLDGRTLSDLYSDYGIIPPSKRLGGLRDGAGRKKALDDPEAAAVLWEDTNQILRSELQNKTFAYLPLKSAQEAFDLMTDLREQLRKHIATIKGGRTT